MRCFLGTKIDEGLVNPVSEAREQFEGLNADIKPVRGENLHLTVKFLGETKEEKVRKVDAVEEVLTNFEPFELELKDVGVFPSRDYIKVIWVGGGKGKKKFRDLMSTIDQRLTEKGFEKDENDPVPHVTIGRVKSGRNKQMIKSKLDDLQGERFGEMVVDNVTLFKSKLTSEGPVYEKIKEYRL